MKLMNSVILLGALSAATVCLAAKGEFGDLCTTGLSMGKQVQTDCSVNAVVDGKTYCFSGDKAKEMFQADQAKVLAKAEENFKQVKPAAK